MLLALPKWDSTRKLQIYTIDGSKYCAKNRCNTMIIMARRHKHVSSSANRPSDVAVTVNINAEFNPSLIWWHITSELNDFQGILSPSIVTGDSDLESSAVYTAPLFFFESLSDCSNRSLPRLLLLMHAEEIIPIFLTCNIYIRLCLPKALIMRWLQL